MSSQVDDFLAHYGKKGMKWGVRQSAQNALVKRSENGHGVKVNSDGTWRRNTAREAQNLKTVNKHVAKRDAIAKAKETGVVDKNLLSRKDVRKLNREGEREFYDKKINTLVKESLHKGDDVLISTKLPGDFAVSVVTGKQFVDHLYSGGVLDVKSTEVFARMNQGQYVQNDKPIGGYKPIKR